MVNSKRDEVAKGKKFDSDKLKWGLLPWDALTDIVRVFMFGANKYGERNWELGMDKSRLFDAALRHMTKWACGDEEDNETGINHLAHAIVSLLMILTYKIRGMDKNETDMSMSYGWTQDYGHGGLYNIKPISGDKK